jgi:hypothetical protein
MADAEVAAATKVGRARAVRVRVFEHCDAARKIALGTGGSSENCRADIINGGFQVQQCPWSV